jgi:hypothetical protein
MNDIILAKVQRYFFASYNYVNGIKGAGFGNLYFNSDKFPSMSFLKANASISAKVKASEVVILSIQELSEEDFKQLSQ